MDQSLDRDYQQQYQMQNQENQQVHQQKSLDDFCNLISDQLKCLEFLFEDQEVDESFLHKFEILSILKGNLDPIDQYIEEITYKNLDYKLQEHPDPTIGKLLKIQQLGTQYLTFLQEINKKKIEVNSQYSQYERENAQKLKEFKKKQQEKIKELKRKNDHADYMLSVFEEKVKKQKKNNSSKGDEN